MTAKLPSLQNTAKDSVIATPVILVDEAGNFVGPGGIGEAVTIPDGADVAQGATTDAAYTDTTGAAAGTIAGMIKGLIVFFTARIGGLTEAAPATDTASSGLNGRLQRIAQRLTTLLPASLGSKAASASLSVVSGGMEYETVAAGQSNQAMGATGAAGDFLSHVVIQPATTAAGSVTIFDDTTAIFTFTGGGTLSDLRPIIVPLSARSVNGAWKVTTGANVSLVAFGDFT